MAEYICSITVLNDTR